MTSSSAERGEVNGAVGTTTLVRIERLAVPECPHDDPSTISFARCYQQAYGRDTAWREGMWCEPCSGTAQELGRRSTLKWRFGEEPQCCPGCGKPLSERWPIDRVIRDLRGALTRPGAVCLAAWSGERIVGGCLGFLASPEELARHVELESLVGTIHSEFPDVAYVAYQAELFIAPESQGRGYGRRLFEARHGHFRSLRDPAPPTLYVVRTKRHPPASTFTWFTQPHWGYRVIAEYHDADDRVILAQRFDRVPVGAHQRMRESPEGVTITGRA